MKALFPFILSAIACATADTVKLIDGTSYEDSKVLYTQGDIVVIEYPDPETPSIKREVRVKSYDILKHTRSTPAERDFKRLMRKIDRIIEASPQERLDLLDEVEHFIRNNPEYPDNGKLELSSDRLREGIPALSSDARKKDRAPDSSAIPKPEPPSNLSKERFAYDLEANRLHAAMMQCAAEGKDVRAMQMFTLLGKFQSSEAYVRAYPLATRLAKDLERKWEKQFTYLQKAMKLRNKQIEGMNGLQQEEAESYVRKQRAIRQAACDQLKTEATANKWSWFTPPADNYPATEDALTLAKSIGERLSRPIERHVPHAGKATPLIAEFWRHIDAEDAAKAAAVLKQLHQTDIPPAYFTPLERALQRLPVSLKKRTAD